MKNKHHKELAIILIIVILLTLNFFLPKGIIGFVSFSIYPEEDLSIKPVEESSQQFKIQPIKEIEIRESKEFLTQPNETLKTMALPAIGSVILNTTDPSLNDTTQNLTFWNISVTDADSDSVKTIFTWWINASSNGNTLKPFSALHLPFEENGSITKNNLTKDYSGYKNNGVVVNATFNADGGVDGFGAYEFNGIRYTYINVSNSDSLSITNELTMAAWIKPAKLPQWSMVFSKGWQYPGDMYALSLHGSNNNYLSAILNLTTYGRTYYNSVPATPGINISKWAHIALTFNGSYVRLYVNGENSSHKACQDPGTGSCNSFKFNFSKTTLNTNTYPLVIGKRGTSEIPFNGTIDDVRIYNKALTENQIRLLYENKSWIIHANETSTYEYWKCQVTPNDKSNDGTAVNSSVLQILPIQIEQVGAPSHHYPIRITPLEPKEKEEISKEKEKYEEKQEKKKLYSTLTPKKHVIIPIYHKYLSFIFLLGIIAAIFLIIKQIKYLKKIIPKPKSIDYEIVFPKIKKKVLPMFNHLLIDTLENIKKEKYHIAKDNHDELLKIYNKLEIQQNKKQALAILLNEINSQIEFGTLKQDINKKIKTYALPGVKKQKIIIILDGASGDKALELAKTPTLNYLAEKGKCGTMHPIKGIAPESGAAQFSILGYSLNKYPGRGPIEALGINHKIKNETALRCNFATFKRNKIISYRTKIPSKELINKLNKIDKDIKIIPTIDYRAVMIVKNTHQKIKNTHPGYIKYKTYAKAIKPKLIKLKSNNKKIDNFIEKAEKILKNKTILIRGAGNKLPKLKKLKNWILMADAPIEIGLGKLLGMEIKQKKDIIKQIRESKKNIYIQIKGPDTYAHKKNLKGKIKSIENIDKLLKPLTKIHNKIICITCDHSTPYTLGIHSKDPVPILIYGKGKDKAKRFTIKECKKGSLKTFNSKDLMKKL